MRFFFDWRAEGTMDLQRIFIERRYKPSQRLHNMINNFLSRIVLFKLLSHVTP